MNTVVIGNVVRTTTGGPEMTVDWVSKSRKRVTCEWMEKGRMVRGNFPVTLLTKLTTTDAPWL